MLEYDGQAERWRILSSMESSAEDNVKDTLINPFYAVVLADYLFESQETEIAKEDWVLTNVKLMKEMGPADWLEQLLALLSTEPLGSPTNAMINPRKAVTLSEGLLGEHKPSMDVADWVAANVKLTKELGAEEWLWRLLHVLETGGAAKL